MQLFYDRRGVEEYYLYDPDRNDLSGWLRRGERLDVIDPIANWISPRLQIRFDLSGEVLQIYRPDKAPFTTLEQERRRAESAEQRADKLAAQLRATGIDPDQVS